MKKNYAYLPLKSIFLLLAVTLLFTKGFAQQPEIRQGATYYTPQSPIVESPMVIATPNSNSRIPQQGTYQIMRVKDKPRDAVPQSLIDMIESYRSPNVILYMKAGDNTWIKILPYVAILASDFKPMPNENYTDESFIEESFTDN